MRQVPNIEIQYYERQLGVQHKNPSLAKEKLMTKKNSTSDKNQWNKPMGLQP